MRDHSIEHLPLAQRLIDRRAVDVLQMADLLREARALIEQLDQLQIDFVDPLAQTFKRGAGAHAAGFFLR